MQSDASGYEKLISLLNSNNVDVKVDALTKLQALFEKGTVEVPDPDNLIGLLKTCLRTSSIHLQSATLSALPVILPTLIPRQGNIAQSPSSQHLASSSSTSSVSPSTFDIPTLRSALIAFLPSGGIVDRLGDKEKVQAKARETLVLLGGYAFRASSGSTLSAKAGKGQETPIAIFERVLKEGGLASKVWKVREQCILTLAAIRRSHHLFPIRPYLSLLVDCLEDTDAHVRDCARQSVVELFTGPGVTDAARADLKKELTKKNVRKAIVDDVLSKLLGRTATAGTTTPDSEPGEGKTEYVPPSLALQGVRPRVASQPSQGTTRSATQPSTREGSRPASRAAMVAASVPATPTAESADVAAVYIASVRDLENEFSAMHKYFEGKETEHNWATREQSIQRVRGMLKGDVHTRYTEAFMAALKDGFLQESLKTLASLRTTVAVNTCLLYAELATSLGNLLDPHCEMLVTNLLKMAGFTKKLTAQQSQSSVTSIISNTSAQPRLILPLLYQTIQEKTVQARAFVIGHVNHYLQVHGLRSKSAIESSSNLDLLVKTIKKGLTDTAPAVRESARAVFWIFEGIWQDSAQALMATLDRTAQNQLEKASPRPGAHVSVPSTPQAGKKSSVAAAIAASRAKAKAIATAPPTLRHQATSASQAAVPRRASSPSVSPKAPTFRPSSPLRMSTSPATSPPRRIVSNSTSFTRSNSSGAIVPSHKRVPSGGSDQPRSHSPSLSDSRRRTGTGTATGASIRKALMTSLPASPTSSSIGPPSPTPVLKQTDRAVPLPTTSRPSLANMMLHEDSLLMAQSVPIPEDSDSEDGMSNNLMTFAAPFEMMNKRGKPPPISPTSDSRPGGSVSNALSSGSIADMTVGQQPVVEDALRARAEQAESAAERLLELVEPEDDLPSLPPALLKTNNGSAPSSAFKTKAKPTPIPITRARVPETPQTNRANSIMRQAALFADSPVHKNGKAPTLLDTLQTQQQETGWWLKRKALFSQATPITANVSPERVQELENCISALEQGDATVPVLKKLALICMENTVADLSSPPPSPNFGSPSSPTPASNLGSLPKLHAELWEKNRTFDRLFKALVKYIQPERSEDELAYGLIVVWEILENQSLYLEGRESDLFALILHARYSNKIMILEGTNAIRDALTAKLDSVYGLTTIHASIKSFHSEPLPAGASEDIKAATYAFGLMALGKFVLRLPAEILEEELPRLKSTLITSLNDRSSLLIRESAAASIIAAQVVLRDETHLFTLLDGLADEKKNLLTYLFDKHGARSTVNSTSGIDKLEREMRRLDTRTSTPLRL